MTEDFLKPNLTHYPRITLHCGKCGNEFNANVIRFKNGEPVLCHICGAIFPKELGVKFAHALQDMFTVKYELDNVHAGFDISFVYKSTFKQPPAPHPFEPSDFPDDESP
jgi:ribosomal protein S27E